MGTARGQQPWGGYGPAPQGQQPYGQPPYVQPPYGQGPYAPWPAPRRQGHVVRNVLAGIGGAFAVVVAIIVVAVANNAGHTMRDTGTASRPDGSDSSSASAQPASAPKKATIGTTITLSGYRGGEQMGVTVVKMIDHASPSDSFFTPPAGDRLVAVQFRLTDSGTQAYSDSPSNGAKLIDSVGQSYQSGLETVDGCQAFAGIENIAPGSSGLGCISFEVPDAAKIVAVQFTLDSGFGPATGQWTVKS